MPRVQFIGQLLAWSVVIALLACGIRAWRRQRQQRAADALRQLAEADDTHDIPDKSGNRLIWRPGDGGQP